MIKVAIFDFDGTLSMTEHPAYLLENRVLSTMGHPPMNREAHLKNWGDPLEHAITERVPGIDGNRFIELWEREHFHGVEKGELDTISPKTLEVLDGLKKSGIKLAILSARNYLEIKHLTTKRHSLSGRIEVVYHKDNLDFSKPHPKAFDKALARFAVDREEVLYVGDAVSDALCAKSAGLHFIALLESGVRRRDDFKGIPVDFFAEEISDISKYINKINLN